MSVSFSLKIMRPQSLAACLAVAMAGLPVSALDVGISVDAPGVDADVGVGIGGGGIGADVSADIGGGGSGGNSGGGIGADVSADIGGGGSGGNSGGGIGADVSADIGGGGTGGPGASIGAGVGIGGSRDAAIGISIGSNAPTGGAPSSDPAAPGSTSTSYTRLDGDGGSRSGALKHLVGSLVVSSDNEVLGIVNTARHNGSRVDLSVQLNNQLRARKRAVTLRINSVPRDKGAITLGMSRNDFVASLK